MSISISVILSKGYKLIFTRLKEITKKISLNQKAEKSKTKEKEKTKHHFSLSYRKNLRKTLLNMNLIVSFFIIFFSQINVSKKVGLRQLNSENYIIMTIQGNGEQYILSDDRQAPYFALHEEN